MGKAVVVGNAGVRRVRRSESQWQGLLDAHEASGLTQRAFCEREGVSEMSLSNWRKRLSGDRLTGRAVSTQSFVDLGTLPGMAQMPTVRLELGGGMVLTISRG